MSELGRATWTEVAGEHPLLVVPLGSVEQHGPHLPLDTDTRIASAVASEVASRMGAALAPAVAYGASGEHAAFAGTLSIGTEALAEVLVQLVRSADHFRGVVIVNGHGGNGEAVQRAAATCSADGRPVLVAHCGSSGADAHAGRAETSLLLHLSPEVVRLDRAAAGDRRPWAEISALVRAEGVWVVSPNGVLGDPAGATAEDGARRFAEICDRVVAEVAVWADA